MMSSQLHLVKLLVFICRLISQMRLIKQQRSQQPPVKGAWGSGGSSAGALPNTNSNRPLSLKEIQMEEEKKQQQLQKTAQPVSV